MPRGAGARSTISTSSAVRVLKPYRAPTEDGAYSSTVDTAEEGEPLDNRLGCTIENKGHGLRQGTLTGRLDRVTGFEKPGSLCDVGFGPLSLVVFRTFPLLLDHLAL